MVRRRFAALVLPLWRLRPVLRNLAALQRTVCADAAQLHPFADPAARHGDQPLCTPYMHGLHTRRLVNLAGAVIQDVGTIHEAREVALRYGEITRHHVHTRRWNDVRAPGQNSHRVAMFEKPRHQPLADKAAPTGYSTAHAVLRT